LPKGYNLLTKRKTKKQTRKNYKEGGPCPRLKLGRHSSWNYLSNLMTPEGTGLEVH
jgi:hypothetical protein